MDGRIWVAPVISDFDMAGESVEITYRGDVPPDLRFVERDGGTEVLADDRAEDRRAGAGDRGSGYRARQRGHVVPLRPTKVRTPVRQDRRLPGPTLRAGSWDHPLPVARMQVFAQRGSLNVSICGHYGE